MLPPDASVSPHEPISGTEETVNYWSTRPVRRRTILGAAAGLGLAALLGGCSSPPKVRLGIHAGSQSLWRYVAAKKDELFRPLGVQPKFTAFASEAEARAAFKDGTIDILATQPTVLPLFAGDGLTVQYFANIAWVAESLPVITLDNSPVRSMANLPGTRLAVSNLSDPGIAYWRALYLANYQTKIEDAATIVVEPDNPGVGMLNGNIDCAIVSSALWAAFQPTGRFRVLSDLSQEWGKLAPGAPALAFGGYVARMDWIEKNQKVVDGFVQINANAFGQYKRDQGGFLQTAADYDAAPVSKMTISEAQAIAGYLGLDSVEPSRVAVSKTDIDSLDRLYHLLAEAGYLKQPPSNTAALFHAAG